MLLYLKPKAQRIKYKNTQLIRGSCNIAYITLISFVFTKVSLLTSIFLQVIVELVALPSHLTWQKLY